MDVDVDVDKQEDAGVDVDGHVDVDVDVDEAVDVDVDVDKAVDEAVDVDVDRAVDESVDVDVDKAVDEAVDVDVDRAVDEAVDVDVDKAVDEAVDEVVDVDKGLEVPFNILLIITSPIENKLKIYQFVNIWLWPLRTLVCTFKLLGWEAKKTCSLHLSWKRLASLIKVNNKLILYESWSVKSFSK